MLAVVDQGAVWATLPLVYLVCALNSTLFLYPYPRPSWVVQITLEIAEEIPTVSLIVM